jgi:hypothetical protein
LNVPGSLTPGNLLVAFLSHSGTITTPAGWNEKIEASNNCYLGWRYVTGSESPSYSFSAPANLIINGIVLEISGAVSSGDPFDQITTGTNVTNTTTPALSITTGVADTLMFFMSAHFHSETLSTAPSGFTADQAATGFFHTFHKDQPTAGSSGSLTAVYGTTTNHYASLFSILPAGAGGPTASSVMIDNQKKSVAAMSVVIDNQKKAVSNVSTIIDGQKHSAF